LVKFVLVSGNDYSFLITKEKEKKKRYGDQHTFWKPSQSAEEIPGEADCSAQPNYRSLEQSTASTVPSPGRWRLGSHSSVGSLDWSLNTVEWRVTAQNSGTIPSQGELGWAWRRRAHRPYQIVKRTITKKITFGRIITESNGIEGPIVMETDGKM